MNPLTTQVPKKQGNRAENKSQNSLFGDSEKGEMSYVDA